MSEKLEPGSELIGHVINATFNDNKHSRQFIKPGTYVFPEGTTVLLTGKVTFSPDQESAFVHNAINWKKIAMVACMRFNQNPDKIMELLDSMSEEEMKKMELYWEEVFSSRMKKIVEKATKP